VKAKSSTTTRSLLYGATTIAYELRYSRRKTLGIQVRPDTSVRVTAPLGAGLAAIEEVLHRKAPWIVRKQAEVAAHKPTALLRRYVAGETHLYLGKQYCLQLDQGPAGTVTLDGDRLRVQAPNPADSQAVGALLERWYRLQAQTVFAEALAAAGPCVQSLGIVPPAFLRIRRMKTRWGSCTTRGDITLNLRLIQVDRALIEYVLVHELCHLLQHNHSPAYYKLLDRALPDWRARKKRLNAAKIG
jgi:predicted metal-dependent hydrolase